VTGPQPNGLVVYDEKRTPLPYETNQPQEDNGTHSGVNRKPSVMRQLEKFLLGAPQGASQECRLTINMTTTVAPCDCTTGACN
jgi:hypothetical protein